MTNHLVSQYSIYQNYGPNNAVKFLSILYYCDSSDHSIFMQDFGWRNGSDAGGTLEDSLFAVPPDFKEDPGRFPDL